MVVDTLAAAGGGGGGGGGSGGSRTSSRPKSSTRVRGARRARGPVAPIAPAHARRVQRRTRAQTRRSCACTHTSPEYGPPSPATLRGFPTPPPPPRPPNPCTRRARSAGHGGAGGGRGTGPAAGRPHHLGAAAGLTELGLPGVCLVYLTGRAGFGTLAFCTSYSRYSGSTVANSRRIWGTKRRKKRRT